MASEDRSLQLAFNGEIYDFEETRKELASKGHTLKSRTDTETVLHLYEEEGVACLKRLNGMFGFALWDARLQRLWLEPYERPAGHLVGVVEPDCL